MDSPEIPGPAGEGERTSGAGPWREANITISGHELSFAQSMTVRVAISTMRMTLADREYRKALGPVGEGYSARLREIEALIMGEAR